MKRRGNKIYRVMVRNQHKALWWKAIAQCVDAARRPSRPIQTVTVFWKMFVEYKTM